MPSQRLTGMDFDSVDLILLGGDPLAVKSTSIAPTVLAVWCPQKRQFLMTNLRLRVQ